MNQQKILSIINKQRAFFLSNQTLSLAYRIKKIKELKQCIKKYENHILEALKKDLNKDFTESYMCEIGLIYEEINYMLKHIKKLSKPKKVKTPPSHFLATSYQVNYPFGNVLIISPFNYPFLLVFQPLIDAFFSGNTVLIKTSELTINSNLVIKMIIEEVFDNQEVAVILGGIEENQFLLKQKFNYIFFTGSEKIGRIVYEQAAKNLTPVTLELGGKCPCIVDQTANLKLAARRIIFGKLINCGQTCVAPDYILVAQEIKDQLILLLKEEINKQYNHLGKIISYSHYQRLENLLNHSHIIYGGLKNQQELKISPTLINVNSFDDLIMQEEIFGPLLPIMSFKNLSEIVDILKQKPEPLALYLFSTNKNNIQHVLTSLNFGGSCINDTLIHLATPYLPFGGVGASGINSYHGKKGFETFSHVKSIVIKSNKVDLPFRYSPFTKIKNKFIRFFLK